MALEPGATVRAGAKGYRIVALAPPVRSGAARPALRFSSARPQADESKEERKKRRKAEKKAAAAEVR